MGKNFSASKCEVYCVSVSSSILKDPQNGMKICSKVLRQTHKSRRSDPHGDILGNDQINMFLKSY